MYLKRIAHGIAFMSILSAILYIVPFSYSSLGHSKLGQFGGSGTLTSVDVHKTDPHVFSSSIRCVQENTQ